MNGVLLDTNVWLWASGASDRLGVRARALIADAAVDVVFSVVSAWEIVIKAGLGKLDLVGAPDDYIRARLRAQRLRVLPCTLEHTLTVSNLPDHHRDPFDRLLIAQAMAEHLSILSGDKHLRANDIDWLDARR